MIGSIEDTNTLKGTIYTDNSINAKLDYVPTKPSGTGSYKLITSEEFQVQTTQTSASSVGDITIDSKYIDSSNILYVRIRDKAGKKKGYFLGSDNFFINYQKANGSTDALTIGGRILHRYTSDGLYSQYSSANSTGYGVYVGSIFSGGRINISKRYNANNSSTINGTYTIEVYTLEYPDNKSVFDI